MVTTIHLAQTIGSNAITNCRISFSLTEAKDGLRKRLGSESGRASKGRKRGCIATEKS